jgi:molybdate transport system permease protein
VPDNPVLGNLQLMSPVLEDVLIPLFLSLKVAGWATVVAGLAGLSAAYLVARGRFPGRELLDAIMTLPMVMPPTVLGYYLLVLLGRRGVIGEWLDRELGISLVFTWQGAVIAAAVVSFPLVYKAARAAFEGVEPQYEQAARVLGKSEWSVFIRVTLPLAWRGILAGAMLAFARALGEFGATLMVAGSLPGRTQTLSIAVYEAVQAGNDEVANFLVIVTSLVCVFILVASGYLLKPRYAAA